MEYGIEDAIGDALCLMGISLIGFGLHYYFGGGAVAIWVGIWLVLLTLAYQHEVNA